MTYIEYREGNIFAGGSRADRNTECIVYVLSATSGKDISETCDLLNQLLQSFEDMIASVADVLKELIKAFDMVSKDICESCKSRRTQHGSSSRTEKPEKAKANIKWSEKYRPP